MKEHAERIKCPECGMEQIAYVKETILFNIYIHQCHGCGFLITESEWEKTTNKNTKNEKYGKISINRIKKTFGFLH